MIEVTCSMSAAVLNTEENRHYVNPEILDWFCERMPKRKLKGKQFIEWFIRGETTYERVVFRIKDPELAMMFKLTWGGK